MKTVSKKILGATLAATVLLGAGGPTAASGLQGITSAQSRTVSAVSISAAPSLSSTVTTASLSAASTNLPGTVTTGATSATSGQWGAAARWAAQQVLNWARWAGPAIWNGIVRAVRGGYWTFVNFYNRYIPSWVKGLVGGVGVNYIYDALKNVFHW